jgi:glycosyltransferase involved in cell wall biosynthesis
LYDDLSINCRLLEDSGLFDAQTYSAAAGLGDQVNHIEHYLSQGWQLGLEPSPKFDGAFLEPYFRSAGFSGPPAVTFLMLRAAGWPVYATRAEAEHLASLIRSSGLFDEDSYAARLYDSGLDPILHYIIVGERLGHAPSNRFDPAYYGERYPDITQAGMNYLAHYVLSGRREGRRPVSVASQLTFDQSRLNPARETILLISHQASRTGAPILAHNIATHLRRRYNLVALLLSGGELVRAFEDCCEATVGPLSYHDDWNPVEAEYLAKRLVASYRLSYAIANSIETRIFIPALASAFVPVLTLVHEFASYTRPKGAMGEALDWSTQVVFSTELTAQSAKREHPTFSNRPIKVLPQGRCVVPGGYEKKQSRREADRLRNALRPKGSEDALVVLGCGTVFIRKAVDVFLSCAAAVAALDLKRPVRFVWIGQGYDPVNDSAYSIYLSEQIARSNLENIAIIDEVSDLEIAYSLSDVFLLSSRLDPLPNVAIEAAFQGLPVVCFENASGMAGLLNDDPLLRECVVPYLDASAAARVIAKFANEEGAREKAAEAIQHLAKTTFDMGHYADQLDRLGRDAAEVVRCRRKDFATLQNDPLFNEQIFLPPGSTVGSRNEAISHFLVRWGAVGTSRQPGENFYFRRPTAGFHPQIYAYENSMHYEAAVINPLAHFVRSGKPDGPWLHEVITPSDIREPLEPKFHPRVALHGHFYHPELVADFVAKMALNSSRCDLFLSTDDKVKAQILREALAGFDTGKVTIRVVPNRGRDIGPFLTSFAKDIVGAYDIVGHVHSKRSLFTEATMGETWREFLWQNLVGGLYPMLDIILDRFATDEKLGLVFPEDPHLPDWDHNLDLAMDLAKCMGITDPLPPFFDFPVGTMFWARTEALMPLFNLKLGWNDYPEEPLPIDGTILHAIERLLPFVARHTGYRYVTTHVPEVTW